MSQAHEFHLEVQSSGTSRSPTIKIVASLSISFTFPNQVLIYILQLNKKSSTLSSHYILCSVKVKESFQEFYPVKSTTEKFDFMDRNDDDF